MSAGSITARAQRRPRNHRATVAALLGLAALLTIPGAIVLTQHSGSLVLLDAAWSIPVGFLLGVSSLLLVRGARGTLSRTLQRSGGAHRIRAAKILAVAGVSMALSASIAIGFYELLLRLEG